MIFSEAGGLEELVRGGNRTPYHFVFTSMIERVHIVYLDKWSRHVRNQVDRMPGNT